MSNEHLKGALVRARRAIQGDVIAPRAFELVHSEHSGDPTKGNYRSREILRGLRSIEIRTQIQIKTGEGDGSRILDHQKTETLYEEVHAVIESVAVYIETGSRITATGKELNEDTKWEGCGCRGKNCSHRQAFRERLARLGINWKG